MERHPGAGSSRPTVGALSGGRGPGQSQEQERKDRSSEGEILPDAESVLIHS